MDKCPICGSNWVGETIPEDQRENFGGRTNFSRLHAITVQGTDEIDHYQCPDCENNFSREQVEGTGDARV